MYKTREERLKQGLGAIKRKYGIYSEEYNDGRKRQNRIRLVTIFFSIAYLSLK